MGKNLLNKIKNYFTRDKIVQVCIAWSIISLAEEAKTLGVKTRKTKKTLILERKNKFIIFPLVLLLKDLFLLKKEPLCFFLQKLYFSFQQILV